jgi:hypothetical protein
MDVLYRFHSSAFATNSSLTMTQSWFQAIFQYQLLSDDSQPVAEKFLIGKARHTSPRFFLHRINNLPGGNASRAA